MPPRLSHFRIDGELGRGGMGVVYRAWDERLQRPVALKVLSDEISEDPRRRAQILEEARAASALTHPGITTVHEVGQEGDDLFIVMELVAGRTLRDMLADGIEHLPLGRIAVQIADALADAHGHGVVHGDIKPENVMVLPDGRLKLLDFGIARRLAVETQAVTGVEEESTLCAPASWPRLAGTLPYMAPELLAGGPADARTDQFALGVLLYEAIAQRRPFAGATPADLEAEIGAATPEPLAHAAPRVLPALARIVDTLLARRPGHRYPSARALHDDLTSVVRDLELEAMRPSAVEGRRAVAVLPFALLSRDAADAYLGGALADALINHLSTSAALLVRPTSTVMRYQGQSVDPLAAGRELNVDVVVDGSIHKVDHRLRVHVQAREVRDGSIVMSSRHEADSVDLFGLQDAVAEATGTALGLAARDHERSAEAPTKNAAAFELFLRAAERLPKFNRWDTRTAIDMLEGATRLDPNFADAWARLGEACANMHLSFEPAGRWLPAAQRAVRRAIALNARNALAYAAQSRILWNATAGFKVRAALRATSTALALNPACQPAWSWQGIVFQHLGLQDEARRSLTAALASNPSDAFAMCFVGQTFLASGDCDGALDYTERALGLDNAGLYANLFLPMVLLYRGDLDRLSRALHRSRSVIGDDPMFVACEALSHAKEGRAAKARAAIRKAVAGRSLVHTHHTVHLAAATFALLAEPAKSVALLRKASRIGLPSYSGFRDDPHFESLRRYAPFLRLMAALRKECDSYQREFGTSGV